MCIGMWCGVLFVCCVLVCCECLFLFCNSCCACVCARVVVVFVFVFVMGVCSVWVCRVLCCLSCDVLFGVRRC